VGSFKHEKTVPGTAMNLPDYQEAVYSPVTCAGGYSLCFVEQEKL